MGYVPFSQNLIQNGSFEAFKTCPEYFTEQAYQSYVKFWDTPNIGTPDYFNSCSVKAGVPKNWMGYAQAYDGNAYMGIVACMQQMATHQIPYREYIRIGLNTSLDSGKTYYAEMHIQLGKSCVVACDGLGMYFSEEPLTANHNINYSVKPQIVTQKIENDKNNWTQICGTFKANGLEKYLIIGNFLSNDMLKYQVFDENLLLTQQTAPMAYYYIDAVAVYPFTDSLKSQCISISAQKLVRYEGNLDVNQQMVLSNLHFAIDKAKILPESFRELDQLAYELRKNQHLKISIFGHTDNTGTVEHNQKLSEDRALAVRNYLLMRGVSKFRIRAKGFGSLNPVAPNNTESGRKLNRRVEIKVFD